MACLGWAGLERKTILRSNAAHYFKRKNLKSVRQKSQNPAAQNNPESEILLISKKVYGWKVNSDLTEN
jgi:hypothetical protein